MPFLTRILTRPLTSERFDLRIGRLLCLPVGPVLLGLALYRLFSLPLTPVQAFLGVLASSTTALLCVLLALVPWPAQSRLRLDQCSCFFAGLLVLAGCFWTLSTFELSQVEALLGILLSLTAALTFILMGMVLPTLRQRRQP